VRPHCTISPQTVRAVATDALAKALPWKAYGKLVSVGRLLDLLLMVASLGLSLSACVRRFRFGFGRETARKAVAANLPDDTLPLTNGLVSALCSFLGPSFRKRTWDIAIDLHLQPFYGDRNTPGVVGGQKKQGTKFFFAYATAVLIHPGQRYTVGLIPVSKEQKPHEIVQALLDQVASFGLRVRGVVLDSGFDSGETILLLQGRQLAYTVPLRRKGQGDNRRNACFALPAGAITLVEWLTDQTRKPVKTLAVVAQRVVARQGHKEAEIKVFAFGGTWCAKVAAKVAGDEERRRHKEARQARKKYRARFAIETSYRQKNEAKGQTTKKDVGYRLLLQGIALLLRQAWVYLTRQMSQANKAKKAKKKGKAKGWMGELPLRRMVDWLGDELKGQYPETKEIELGVPVGTPEGLKAKWRQSAQEAGSGNAPGRRKRAGQVNAQGPGPPGRSPGSGEMPGPAAGPDNRGRTKATGKAKAAVG
jgi:hypothetical protein